MSVHKGSMVAETKGFVGTFRTTVESPRGKKEVHHGVAVIATGAHSIKPIEYGYGTSSHVYLNLDLDVALRNRDVDIINARSAVFIQCVGSREPQRPYCSRVCCSHSIENAIRLKEINPDMDVWVLYRDIHTYGLRENLYKEARSKGIVFVRFDVDRKPRVEIDGGRPRVVVLDPILQRDLSLQPDILPSPVPSKRDRPSTWPGCSRFR